MRMDKRELKWDNMLAGIRAQPDYLRGGAADALHAAAAKLPMRVPSRVYLVGCGDSHYAGLATRFAFERWSGIPTEALESLEFSRYAVHSAPSDALVIAVSNSGRVVRTVECARVARERGIASLGLTYNPASPLADAASMLLAWTYQDVGFGPGTLSYLASLVGLYAVAVRLGQLTGRLDDRRAAGILEAIAASGDDVAATIDANTQPSSEIASTLTGPQPGCIVGGSELRYGAVRHGEVHRGRGVSGRRAGARGVGPRAVLLHPTWNHDVRARTVRRERRPGARTAPGRSRYGRSGDRDLRRRRRRNGSPGRRDPAGPVAD